MVYVVAMASEKILAFRQLVGLILAPLCAAVIMVLAIKNLKDIIFIGNFFELLIVIVAGALAYLICLWGFDRLHGGSVFAHFQWVRERMLKDVVQS